MTRCRNPMPRIGVPDFCTLPSPFLAVSLQPLAFFFNSAERFCLSISHLPVAAVAPPRLPWMETIMQ